MKLFAFYFDKTITLSDTILPICKHLCKIYNSNFSFFFIQLAYLFFRMKLINSKVFKEFIIKLLLKGKDFKEIESKVEDFFISNQSELFNPVIIKIIADEKSLDNKIVVISSNLDLFVNPLKRVLNIDEVFATKVKTTIYNVVDSIEGENCSGVEKEKVLRDYNANFKFDEIISYGDSAGDFEMLKISDKSFIVEYRFNSFIDNVLCKLNYLMGKLCSRGFEVNIKEFQSKR